MSLRLRLNLMITALLMLVMILGTLLLLRNARDQVRAEIESVSAVATHFLDADTLYFPQAQSRDWPGLVHLQGLEHLRHLNIAVYDGRGKLIYTSKQMGRQSQERQAPQWFYRLMTRHLTPVVVKRDIHANGVWLGQVLIEADPSYEIDEVWDDTVDLFTLVAIFFVAVNCMVFWAVGHALRPVGQILKALKDFEYGNLNARLPPFELRELSSISEKFNHMAQSLQRSIAHNHRLSQQLIYLQEEERKALARDLHDELGQCLTAILADGTALLKLSAQRFPEAVPSAQAVVDVTHQMMGLLRAMLQRLRPDVLDGIGLKPALDELIAGWRQRNPGIACIVKIAGDMADLPEALRITAYRVIQECLTNIMRHAAAQRVRIEVRRTRMPPPDGGLEIEVEDDGRGFDPARSEGFGLSGMRERVEGLGGTFTLTSQINGGTRIFVALPLSGRKS